ncbi:MAG TPA: peptide deformylase [Thermodesulfobacteriota bacterium]|nr:peptide deformylase [Thermodesulfobacteriota bacterium]
MAVRPIRRYPDPVLKQRSEPVARITPEIVELCRDMAETMYAAPGVGLAANQVGVLLRIFTADCSGPDEPRQLITMINPELVEAKGEVKEEEGCLSVPDYFAPVTRYAEVTVRGLDLEGREQVVTASGLLARCFQHELDHLDGRLFVDRLGPVKRDLFRRRYRKYLAAREEADAPRGAR